jgi:hypothetical protein
MERQKIVVAIRMAHAVVDESIPFAPNMAQQDVTALRQAAFTIVLNRLLDEACGVLFTRSVVTVITHGRTKQRPAPALAAQRDGQFQDQGIAAIGFG